MQNHQMGTHEMPHGHHGMLVLGTRGKIYMLHLAMRGMGPHRVQLILEADLQAGPHTMIHDREFVGDGASLESTGAAQIYFEDRNHPDNAVPLYTFRPREGFSLSEILDGRRSTFRGDVVRGHFEREAGSAPTLLSDIVVKVEQIVYAQALQSPAPGTPHPLENGKLAYLLFGAHGEYFVDHQITLHGQEDQPGDNAFHQVFQVGERTSGAFNFDGTRQALAIEVDSEQATPLGRLPGAGGTFTAQLRGLVEGVDSSLPLELTLEPEHYLEVLM
jgi:hypothetical protein